MHLRIAVDLTGAGQQQPGSHPTGQAKHVVSAQKTGLGRLDRIELIVNRGGWTGQVPDPVHLQLDRLGDIVSQQLEARMSDPALNVALAAREVVVEADHLLTSLHQPVNQMGAQKPCPTGDEMNPHLRECAAPPQSRQFPPLPRWPPPPDRAMASAAPHRERPRRHPTPGPNGHRNDPPV